jgi:chromosome segregation ATPase
MYVFVCYGGAMEAAVRGKEAVMTEWNDSRLDELGTQVQGIAQSTNEGVVQLSRVDERMEQLDKRVDQLEGRIGRFESKVDSRFTQLETQIDTRFGRIESGISQLHGQFQELQHTLVQVAWALAIALLVVVGGVITAQL